MRLLSAIVCDDIRTELNGKDIIIGCYNNVILLSKVPANLTSLNFRFLFDQEPAGKHRVHIGFFDPSGKMMLGSIGDVIVEDSFEPFVVRIGSAPFHLGSFGKYEVRFVKGEPTPDIPITEEAKGELLLEFLVREPKTEVEKGLFIPQS
jgi:hypothetical protein